MIKNSVRMFYLLLRVEGKNMENKSYEEYLNMKESELCREYRERYGVRWPNKPENAKIDENLFNAIEYKGCRGK